MTMAYDTTNKITTVICDLCQMLFPKMVVAVMLVNNASVQRAKISWKWWEIRQINSMEDKLASHLSTRSRGRKIAKWPKSKKFLLKEAYNTISGTNNKMLNICYNSRNLFSGRCECWSRKSLPTAISCANAILSTPLAIFKMSSKLIKCGGEASKHNYKHDKYDDNRQIDCNH